MTNYQIYSMENAPEESRAALGGLKQAFGTIPNVAGAMAGSPVLIKSLSALFSNVHSGSFTERQIQILLLTNAVTNSADWAVGFHSFLALEQGLSSGDVEAIREGRLPTDPKDAALSRIARALISTRGHVTESDAEAFLQGGFDQRHLLEIIAIVAASTITNYTVNVAHPPLEQPFDQYTWTRT